MVYSYFELLTLNRPTKIDELFSKVPKPNRGLPRRRLPKWEQLRLDDKLSIIKAPKGAVTFTRGKLGEKLWSTSEKLEFDLRDPYGYQTCFTYDPLHDSHLISFFSKTANRELLCKQGLITRDSDVICTLEQFNKYRRYLNKEYLGLVNAWRKYQERLAEEKRLIKLAKMYIEKDREKLIKNSILIEKTKTAKQQKILDEKQKQELLQARNRQYTKRLRAIEKKRAQEALMRKKKGLMNNERIRNKIEAAKSIENSRKIRVVKKLQEAEMNREHRMVQQNSERQSKKRNQEINNWNLKAKQQLLARKKNEHILEEFHSEQLTKILARNKKATQNYLRLEAERYIKKENKIMATISKKKQKAIAEAISKATKGEVDTYTAEEVVAALKPSIEKDPIHIIHGARSAIEQLKHLPEPVHIAVNRLLENVVTTYVNKNITQLLDDVLSKAKEALFKKFNVKFMRKDIGSIKAKPSPRSLISQVSGSKTEIKKGHVNGFMSAVSFGSVTTIGTIKVLGELRSTKERPPTPVPSLTELAEVIFREPVSVIDIYADEFNTDQHNFERLFMALYAQLLKAVLRRTEKSLEKKQQLLYSPEKELTMEAVSQKLTNAILTKHIENLADSEEMQLAIDTLVRQVLENYQG